MTTLLAPDLLDETLHALPGWHGDATTGIWREVHLTGEAAATLRQKVDEAGTCMHHLAQVREVSGGLRFELRTLEVDGVSELDITLASHISDTAHRLDPSEPGVHAERPDPPEVHA